MNDPAECLEDDQFVKLSVSTTLSADNGMVWNMGFQRRRVIVSEDVIFRDITLQGVASDFAPFIFFFMFHNNSDFICENCTLEHACAGTDANFFLESMRLVRCLPLQSAAWPAPPAVSYTHLTLPTKA